jgi:hypothetical protein
MLTDAYVLGALGVPHHGMYFRWQAVMAEAVAGVQAQPDQHPLRGIMQACSKE